jgi:hypothetical protein
LNEHINKTSEERLGHFLRLLLVVKIYLLSFSQLAHDSQKHS